MLSLKHLLVVAFVFAALLAIACGGDKNSHTEFRALSPLAATQTPEPATTPIVADPALEGALLRPADLGPSWTAVPFEGAPTRARTFFCGEEVDLGINNAAFSTLIGPNDIVIEAIAIPSSKSARAIIEQVKQASQNCAEYVSTDGVNRTVWKIQPADFGSFGDASVALQGSAPFVSPNQSSDAYLVLISRDDVLLSVIDVVADHLDRTSGEAIVRLAYDTLSRTVPSR